MDRLSVEQLRALESWLGPVQVIADHSWPLQDGITLECEVEGRSVIVKAAAGPGATSHIDRELRAHKEVLSPLSSDGSRGPGLGEGFPRLRNGDGAARVLVVEYLPGELVEGTPAEGEPWVYEAAGALLRRLHASAPARADDGYPRQRLERIEHELAAGRELLEAGARREASRRAGQLHDDPEEIVATHGDFQPRNWLFRAGAGGEGVGLVDFGRFGWRPWYTDLVRLEHQQFAGRPHLREAMARGLGRAIDWDAAHPDAMAWRAENLMQALATVVWATGIGDHAFADQGRLMLERTLRAW